jgi:bifunctional non-homologous end joining protein LigD
MSLRRLPAPFSDPDWPFELKHDGFRALCYCIDQSVKLVSRRDHVYKSFASLCESIAADLHVQNAILDGEIVCLDARGHSQFNTLLYRRGEPCFYAFDLIWLDGENLREVPLIERKKMLRGIIPQRESRLLYVDHIEGRGEELFRLRASTTLRESWRSGNAARTSKAIAPVG